MRLLFPLAAALLIQGCQVSSTTENQTPAAGPAYVAASSGGGSVLPATGNLNNCDIMVRQGNRLEVIFPPGGQTSDALVVRFESTADATVPDFELEPATSSANAYPLKKNESHEMKIEGYSSGSLLAQYYKAPTPLTPSGAPIFKDEGLASFKETFRSIPEVIWQGQSQGEIVVWISYRGKGTPLRITN